LVVHSKQLAFDFSMVLPNVFFIELLAAVAVVIVIIILSLLIAYFDCAHFPL
jgi:hypothetical protein